MFKNIKNNDNLINNVNKIYFINDKESGDIYLLLTLINNDNYQELIDIDFLYNYGYENYVSEILSILKPINSHLLTTTTNKQDVFIEQVNFYTSFLKQCVVVFYEKQKMNNGNYPISNYILKLLIIKENKAIIHCKHRISSSLDIVIEIKDILNNENLPYKSEDILQSLSKSDKILFHKLFSLDWYRIKNDWIY